MVEEQSQPEIAMDTKSLYIEEVFTDRRIGTIQRLTPVDADGKPVEDGKVLYVGQTQLMTRAGPLPLNFEIDGNSLADAADKFGAGATTAMEEAVQRLEDLRRESASSIIVPEGGAGSGGGGGKFVVP
jgi:hypothetical protein